MATTKATPPNSKLVHIVFHVPEGLEFVAKNEVNSKLAPKLQEQQQSTITTTIVADPNTGRVHLICSIDLSALVTMIKSIHLLSVRDIVLVASMVVLPEEIFEDREKTCQIIADTATATDFDPYVTSLQYGPTTDENNDNTAATTKTTFRGTFYKEELTHSIKTPELASWIGFGFGTQYPDYKVNLEQFNYEAVGLWTRTANHSLLDLIAVVPQNQHDGGDYEHEKKKMKKNPPILLMVGVTIKTNVVKNRNRQFFGKTSLNPCIAYCLAQVANPSPGQVVLDMCCGTGTIPIEGASCYPDAIWIGSEVHETTLCEKARGNVLHSGVQNTELMLGDGRCLCLRDDSVDIILTDWPWGLREGSFLAIQRLYPRFMKQISRVLRSKGKAYIVTQGHKLLNRVLDYPWCAATWDINEIKPIAIGGHKVSLYILTKKL
ncbi:putative RNA methylase family UPF0020-domain-containing protein [Zychaea mexicana]|uniref:putative RNA methylase family UPF0020-domain-containing protein n=1 Tax=Zychaea mexicana TaxID=64656 RepID=UPI0022FEED8E|nr:putative RNA methylase family UPF0020-domain-containing protein [Zychaea mexicana]KAI9493239.1 putative RNA methylase family UPF0020-domain-containing protein [Zychaea mexicana]